MTPDHVIASAVILPSLGTKAKPLPLSESLTRSLSATNLPPGRAGTVELRIPKLRKGPYFPGFLEPRRMRRP